MKYGVNKDGEFEERELVTIAAKGFQSTMLGRVGTYDGYVMKEINKSYGMLECEGKVVLDIGANIGCFSRMALEKGARRVIAIEPEPNNFAMLELNNASPNRLIPIQAALMPDAVFDTIQLFTSPTGKNPGNSSVYSRNGRYETEVKCISVKDLFNNHPDITVAKIDCEGAEFDLLPILTGYKLEQIALEYHINGFGTERVRLAHEMLIADGWVATREPKIQENLWQTLAAYRRS